MRQLLITGACGMIGGKLRAHFKRKGGYELRLLSLNERGDPEVVTADLSDGEGAWTATFEGVETVIHLAGAPSPAASWDEVQRDNIDLSYNVFRAAERHRVKRIVFASSNWILAGHRFGKQRLTPDTSPAPTNPYGASKLMIERAGRDLAIRTGISFIALRIGFNRHTPGNIPGPDMEHGVWGQQMWLGDKDLVQGFECAVTASNVSFAVLNLMSDNKGMRWDLSETTRVIGYGPTERHDCGDPPLSAKERALQAFLEHQACFTRRSIAW